MLLSWKVKLCLGPYGLRPACRLCIALRRMLHQAIGWNSTLQRFE